MTALTMSLQDPRATMVRVSFHCQRVTSFGRSTLSQVRQHLCQKGLILQQTIRLPNSHDTLLSLLGDIRTSLVDTADTRKLVDTLDSVRVNRWHGKPDDTLIGSDVDTPLTLKDTDKPAKFKFIHNYYVPVVATIVSGH